MTQDAHKGRVVGFIALAALLILVVVAVYSSQSGPGQGPGASAADSRRLTSITDANAGVPAGAPAPAPPKPTEDLAHIPRVKGVVTAGVSDVALSPQARMLAERIKCVCGCKNMMLADCTCEKPSGSQEMKRYLQNLVNAGKAPAEIESAMAARFGDKIHP